MQKLANLISIVFHPLLIPTFGLALLFWSDAYFTYMLPVNYRLMILAMFFFITFVTPITMFYIMYLQRFISHISIKNRDERTIPYMVVAVMYLYVYYLLKKLNLSPIVLQTIVAMFFTLLSVLVVNLFWKVSAHTAAIGGVVAAIYYLNIFQGLNLQYFLLFSVVLAGIIGTARLQLNAHSLNQVLVGYGLGFIMVFYVLSAIHI